MLRIVGLFESLTDNQKRDSSYLLDANKVHDQLFVFEVDVEVVYVISREVFHLEPARPIFVRWDISITRMDNFCLYKEGKFEILSIT